MNVFLMHRDTDFDPKTPLPWNARALIDDLGLEPLFETMAAGDPFLLEVASPAVLAGPAEIDTILYRQAVLRDCLARPPIVRSLYELALRAIEAERREFFGARRQDPGTMLWRSLRVMGMFLEHLQALRRMAERHAGAFASEGFRNFFARIEAELTPAFFAEAERHLARLRFRRGVQVAARLGPGLRGTDYRLLRYEPDWREHLRRLFAWREQRASTVTIAPRDIAGARYLSELRDRGVNAVAAALAGSVDGALAFFRSLRRELAFYLGCLNLHERLQQMGEPVCFPVPAAAREHAWWCEGLYDVVLALVSGQPMVGNDVAADGRRLVLITGANRGGKSTFLRSVGLAQLMMQCGMFVPARQFRASLCDGLITHFRREEDRRLESGKLDEELARMSAIVDRLTPHALVLLNESFAATNEREGSEIARQIVRALVDRDKRVFFVTHLHDFAESLHAGRPSWALFLRAERRADGHRSFRMQEAEPLSTSFGRDLYARIFGT